MALTSYSPSLPFPSLPFPSVMAELAFDMGMAMASGKRAFKAKALITKRKCMHAVLITVVA